MTFKQTLKQLEALGKEKMRAQNTKATNPTNNPLHIGVNWSVSEQKKTV